MTAKQSEDKRVLPILGTAISTLVTNKGILFPFVLIGFIQLFFLELIYFIPRYPLKVFFGPVITTFWGQEYMHYPLFLSLLPRLFQVVHVPIYIFVNSFFIAAAVLMIININEGKGILLKPIMRRAASMYLHIVLAAMLIYLSIWLISLAHDRVVERAVQIRSETGKFYILKRVVLDSVAYVSLFISVALSTIFAYLIPIIVIEKKKIVVAIKDNFVMLFKAPLLTFLIVLIPSLLFIPLLILRKSFGLHIALPEMKVLALILSIFFIIAIDAIIYTSVTTYYLWMKEK